MVVSVPSLLAELLYLGLGAAIYVFALIATVRMFQNQDTVWGVGSVLTLIVPIVPLVRGFQKKDEWQMRTPVFVWLGLCALWLAVTIGASFWIRVYITDIGIKREDFPTTVREIRP